MVVESCRSSNDEVRERLLRLNLRLHLPRLHPLSTPFRFPLFAQVAHHRLLGQVVALKLPMVFLKLQLLKEVEVGLGCVVVDYHFRLPHQSVLLHHTCPPNPHLLLARSPYFPRHLVTSRREQQVFLQLLCEHGRKSWTGLQCLVRGEV